MDIHNKELSGVDFVQNIFNHLDKEIETYDGTKNKAFGIVLADISLQAIDIVYTEEELEAYTELVNNSILKSLVDKYPLYVTEFKRLLRDVEVKQFFDELEALNGSVSDYVN